MLRWCKCKVWKMVSFWWTPINELWTLHDFTYAKIRGDCPLLDMNYSGMAGPCRRSQMNRPQVRKRDDCPVPSSPVAAVAAVA